jgi:hypothetical protein
MTGAILGSTPLGSLVLGGVNQPAVSGFNPAWAINVNAIVTVRRIDQ